MVLTDSSPGYGLAVPGSIIESFQPTAIQKSIININGFFEDMKNWAEVSTEVACGGEVRF